MPNPLPIRRFKNARLENARSPFALLPFVPVLLLLVLLTTCSIGWAQTASHSKKTVNEKEVLKTIYNLTKSAKTAKDYTNILDRCATALKTDLSDKARAYLVSLTGWAHCRRGQLRLETAQQLDAAQHPQAAEAMDRAMDDLNAAVEADAKRWRSSMIRGIAWMHQRQYEKAVKDFSTVIALKPAEPNGWFNRAEAHYHAGQFDQAVADYSNVLAMQETDLQALTGRGLSYFALKQFQKALDDFQAVDRQQPDDVEALINLGDAYQQLGRWKETESAYAKAIRIDPTPIGLQRFAWFKATCPDVLYQDIASANQMIQQAIAVSGKSAAILDTLAAIKAAQGDFESAKSTEAQAIQLAGHDADTSEDRSNKEYQVRMALYEQGVPFQQKKELKEKQKGAQKESQKNDSKKK